MDYLPEAKSARLLAMYARLLSGEALHRTALAMEYGVTVRSIQRDIETLRCFLAEQRLPQDVVYDRRERAYKLVDNVLRSLSNSEILAVCKILLESRSMRRDEMMPILDKLIDCCVPEESKRAVTELIANEKHHYIEPHHGKRVLDGLWEIGQAVKERRALEITYQRMKEPRLVRRRVQPVGIMFSEYYFYLTAFLGIMGGVNSNGDFNPQGTVSRAEACTILSRLLYPETRLTPGENTSSQTPGQSETTTDPLALLPAGTDVAGNSRIHYAGDVAYDYCRALEQEIGIPIFYLPEFTEKADGLLSYASFNDFSIDATYFQMVLTELQKMKSAYDLYPDGFLREIESKKGSHSTEIILCPYTFPGYTSYGVHVYDYSDDPVKVDQVFYTGIGDPQYYSHEMGHMVMSSAAIQGGWSTVCDYWESMNARAGVTDYVSSYAMSSRPEDWAETWAFLWHDTDTVRTLVNGGNNVLREKVQYMTNLLAQNYSTFNASTVPWSDLL